jgi:TetR/AcrR family transcriptional regulator, repressor for uid operon
LSFSGSIMTVLTRTDLAEATAATTAVATLPHGIRSVRREAQTQRIVEAARACFLKSGFQGASMGDICAAAGMSPGALYRYFPSKESLIEAICAADREDDLKVLMLVANNPSLADGLTESLLAYVLQMHVSGMAPLMSEIAAEAMRNQTIGQSMERSMCEVRDVIASAIKASAARGDIEPVAPVDVVVDMMIAMGHGLATRDLPRLGTGCEAMEPVIRAMVDAILRPKKQRSFAVQDATPT